MNATSFGGRTTDLATHTEPLLSVHELQTQFVLQGRTIQAVRSVSFQLARGEKLGIVGESGCGKTALALSIVRLLEPPGRVVAGDVRLRGRSLMRLPEEELCKVRGKEISLIFQDPTDALDPVRPIGNQIAEALRAHNHQLGRRAIRARTFELLSDVEIVADRARDYPHQFSGGMQQRVMIAIALANNPDVIIADEPTTALDVTTQAQILDLLNRLATERGSAIIVITHNLGVIAEFCDTLRVMYAGRFVEAGAVSTVLASPVHPYTVALGESQPTSTRSVKGPLTTISGLPPSLETSVTGCSFAPRCAVGRDRSLCHDLAPPVVEPSVPRRYQTYVECHFANYSEHGPEDSSSAGADPPKSEVTSDDRG